MLSLKLAWGNLKKGLSNFAPFLMATIVMYTLLFIVISIGASPSLDKLVGGDSVALLMNFAVFILGIFGAIILIYSYRFLQVQRAREFGLYDILGLGKKRIITVSAFELVFSYFITIVLGTIIGFALSKFLFLIFINLMGGNYFNLIITPQIIGMTSLIFLAYFVVLFFIGAIIIKRSSSLDLLHEESKGEKEPKANRLLAFISIILLIAGYGIALSVQNPVEALVKFMIAVLLVILGTYSFYISFTIWYLKWRKKRDSYYEPKNFITISSMLYRMKQNAVGLANITILLSMALVTIVVTVGIFVSTTNTVNNQYPQEAKTTFVAPQGTSRDTLSNEITQTANKANVNVHNVKTIAVANDLMFRVASNNNGHLTTNKADTSFKTNNVITASLITRDDLMALGNKVPKLKDGEIAVYNLQGNASDDLKTVTWFNQKFQVTQHLDQVKHYPGSIVYTDTFLIVVPNATTFDQASKEYLTSAGIYEKNNKAFLTLFDLKPSDTKCFDKAFNTEVKQHKQITGYTSYRSETNAMQKAIIGGFMFIGFVLGIGFILGAALIIYYKQLSEGAQDKRSYRILQEIGLSKREISRSIKAQVRFVFFLPIVVTIIHFLFAYRMIKNSINIFGLSDNILIIAVSALVIAIVALIYWIIYKATSRVYYKIVER